MAGGAGGEPGEQSFYRHLAPSLDENIDKASDIFYIWLWSVVLSSFSGERTLFSPQLATPG